MGRNQDKASKNSHAPANSCRWRAKLVYHPEDGGYYQWRDIGGAHVHLNPERRQNLAPEVFALLASFVMTHMLTSVLPGHQDYL